MHFIFGYSREEPVKIEKNLSKATMVGLALLIVSLLIFLSFENLAKDSSVPPSIFKESPSLDKANELTGVEKIEFQKDGTFPEKNSKLAIVSHQAGVK
jgi:hypothetical protein